MRSLLQLFQICGVRVGERLIEVFDQGIQIGDVRRLRLHRLVPLPDGHGHFALTHKAANDGVAAVQRLPGGGKDLFKVGRTAAKACGAEQEYPLVAQLLQKIQRVGIGLALVCPEAHIQGVCCQRGSIRCAEIAAICLRQLLLQGLCQQCGVAGFAAEYDGVTHHFYLPQSSGKAAGCSCAYVIFTAVPLPGEPEIMEQYSTVPCQNQGLTIFSPFPARKLRRLPVVISISRCNASLVVHAMCGVSTAPGRLRNRLWGGSGSVVKASAP